MPDIFCPLTDAEGNVVVRLPMKGEPMANDDGSIAIALFDFNYSVAPIYRRLSSDEYVVVRKDELAALVAACQEAESSISRWARMDCSGPENHPLLTTLRAALAPFGKEKTDG